MTLRPTEPTVASCGSPTERLPAPPWWPTWRPTAYPRGTTVQCAASHSIVFDLGAEVSAAGSRLELISPNVSVSDGFAVGTGNQLEVVNADPMPGVLVEP